MTKHSKRYISICEKFNFKILYSLKNACKMIKQIDSINFDESIDMSIHIETKNLQAHILKSNVLFPYGNGKKTCILALGTEAEKDILKESGADFWGGNDMIKKIESKKFDFNQIIATPSIMPSISKIAKIIGPMGLMPSQQLGTVTDNPKETIEIIRKGKVNFRANKNGAINISIGRKTFSENNIYENCNALLVKVLKLKPSNLKGIFIRKITLSATMSPGINIDLTQLN